MSVLFGNADKDTKTKQKKKLHSSSFTPIWYNTFIAACVLLRKTVHYGWTVSTP